MTHPADKASSVANALAVISGWRYGATYT